MQRRSGKIDPYEFLLVFVFRSLTSVPLGLGLLTSFLNKLVSRPAIHQRFHKKTELFFAKCLSLILTKRLLHNNQITTGLSKTFSEILIIDSSSWKISPQLQWAFPGCGGSAGQAGCKLQFCYDYLTGEVRMLEEMKGTFPDQKYAHNLPSIIKESGIVICDLGYWTFNAFFNISKKGAFFLSRFHTQAALYIKEGDLYFEVDVMKILKECLYPSIEMELYLKNDNKFVKLRLVGFAVPEEIANTRKRKARRTAQKKGYTVSQRTLFYCNWSLFVTNASMERLPGEMLRTLYRLRWNVELIFKSWKSVVRIHKTNVRKNQYRLRCELYAKLILVTIVHRIYHHLNSYMWNTNKRELSLDKLWKYIQARIGVFHARMLEGFKAFSIYVNNQRENIMCVCEKYHQHTRKTTLQLIDEMHGDTKPIQNRIKVHLKK